MRLLIGVVGVVIIVWAIIMLVNIPKNIYRLIKEKNAEIEEDFNEVDSNFEQKQKTKQRKKGK